MAKNFKKGIDRVFSPTTQSPLNPPEGDLKEVEGVAGHARNDEPKAASKKDEELAAYNLRYPKELQKKIKRFCIENDGIDMRDVFMQGAIMYMEKYN
jgi:hypothetical protein